MGQLGHGVHDFSVGELGDCIVGETNGLVHRLEGEFHCHCSYLSDIIHWTLGQVRGVFICNPN